MRRKKEKKQFEGMGEKPKNFKAAWIKLFNYMERYKRPFIIALTMAVIGTMLTLFGPNILKEMTDLIQEGVKTGIMDLGAIERLAIILVALYAASAVITLIQGYMLASITQKVAGNLRTDISTKINRIPLRYFDKTSSGDLMSRVTNDADLIGQQMNMGISTMVESVTLLIGSLIMMGLTNLTMTAAAVLSTVLGFVLMIVIMSKSQKYFDRQQECIGKMNGHVTEIYTAHNIVKSYNGVGNATAEFDKINDDLQKSGFYSQFLSGLMMPLMVFIGNLGYVAVCIVGSILVINGSITIGTIVAFMIYIRLFTTPLQQMSQGIMSMQSVAAGAERVFEFLEETELEDDSGKAVIENPKGHVEFKDVHFGYVPGNEIIHGFSAEVKPGQKVAIVGPTGAGKTTMVNLLMKFYEVDGGDILIDGVSVKDLSRANIHDQFCMVLQDTWLFEGTVRENIVYNREGISDEEVVNACKAVGIDHFVTTLPEGYDTVLDENTSLSVGQKQQLTLARAMIDKSPMLILDEATSSVDTRTELIIQKAMDELSTNRTAFVIAHRLSTIKNSDLILVMRNGSIVEQGTHEELLEKGGFYQELYNSQFDEGEAA